MFFLSWHRSAWSYVVIAIAGSLNAAGQTLTADQTQSKSGVILIDQQGARTGRITPGDKPGFPVTISQSGSYRLASDLTVSDLNTTAIDITAPDVTLDLNGFSIIGPAACSGNPLSVPTCPAPGTGVGVLGGTEETFGPSGIRVSNGSVRGMGSFGIFLNGPGSSVEKLNVSGNAGGGMSIFGTAINSTANNNGQFGILALTVRDCNSVANGGDGILLNASGGIAITNVSSFNGGNGINAPNGTVIANTVVRNVSFGISAKCPSSIENNTVVNNQLGSIQTINSGCTLAGNATLP